MYDIPKVAPPVSVVSFRSSKENISACHGAERALLGVERVLEVAPSKLHVRPKVLGTCTAVRRLEAQVLVCSADDIGVGHTDRQHGTGQVCKGANVIHKDPEARERVGIGQNTAEDQAESEQQIGNVATRLRSLETSNHEVGEGRSEQQKSHQKQEHENATLRDLIGRDRVVLETNRIIPTEVHQSGHQRVPG